MNAETRKLKEIAILKVSNAADISYLAIKNTLVQRHFFIGSPVFDSMMALESAAQNLKDLMAEQEKTLELTNNITEED